MHITAPDEAIAAALHLINGARTRCGTTKVVAVDGPSGAGKTDFATALAGQLPSAQLLHMDDLYPGWSGLAQAVTDLHHWQRWAAREETLFAVDGTRSRADLIINTSP